MSAESPEETMHGILGGISTFPGDWSMIATHHQNHHWQCWWKMVVMTVTSLFHLELMIMVVIISLSKRMWTCKLSSVTVSNYIATNRIKVKPCELTGNTHAIWNHDDHSLLIFLIISILILVIQWNEDQVEPDEQLPPALSCNVSPSSPAPDNQRSTSWVVINVSTMACICICIY